MKIALTSQNKRTISGHAGKCNRFYIYELDENNKVISKEFLELEPENMLHFHFHGSNPDAHHPLFDMDIMITGDMGPGFPNKLASRGVRAVMTDVTELDQVIEMAVAGTLPIVQPAQGHCNH